ncbi:unnamed protein product [Rotaria magnacalcarata]
MDYFIDAFSQLFIEADNAIVVQTAIYGSICTAIVILCIASLLMMIVFIIQFERSRNIVLRLLPPLQPAAQPQSISRRFDRPWMDPAIITKRI